jgi:Flp pilus assembly protein CpaB
MPRRFVPEGALFELPTDRRVTLATSAGEILLRSRVSAAGAGAIGSTLTAKTQAVTISLGEAPAPVQPGDLVDVISVQTDSAGSDVSSSDSPSGGEGGLGAERVAESAVVLQVAQGQATLAVQSKQVAALVAAAASVPISLVILQ